MTSINFSLIKSTVQLIENNASNFIDKLGIFKEKITDGVSKYSAFNQDITHFLVFDDTREINEISFYCENINFSLGEIESEFGSYKQGYNFRENYTQFTFCQDSKIINEMFLVKDNKFVFEENGLISEITPQGDKTSHNDVVFNAFCLSIHQKD